MNIQANIYIYPEKEDEVNEVLTYLNLKFENSFIIKNKHLISSKSFNMSDALFEKIKKAVSEKDSHILVFWISDDIGQSGFDFYNYKTKLSVAVDSDILSKEVSFTDLLIFCGMKSFIEREIV